MINLKGGDNIPKFINGKVVLESGETVKLYKDLCFKFLFANEKYIELTELLAGVALGIDEKELRGKVRILNSEYPTIPSDKHSRSDLVLNITYNNEARLLVEVNMKDEVSSEIVKRNWYYSNLVVSSGLKSSDKYRILPDMITLNFDDYSIRNKYDNPVDIYSYRMMIVM